MSLSAWLALFVLEAVILLAYFHDELQLLALRRRYSLERDGRGFRGIIEGRTVSLPNVRNVNEDVEIQVHVPVDIGQLRQAAQSSDDFDATFRLEADPAIRYGLWSGEAETRALKLARLGAFGANGGVLSLRVPRARRFRDGPDRSRCSRHWAICSSVAKPVSPRCCARTWRSRRRVGCVRSKG